MESKREYPIREFARELDEHRIAAADAGGRVCIFSVGDIDPLNQLETNWSMGGGRLAWSPQDEMVFTANYSTRIVKAYSIASGKEVWQKQCSYRPGRLAFWSDRRYLYSFAAGEYWASVLNAENGSEEGRVAGLYEVCSSGTLLTKHYRENGKHRIGIMGPDGSDETVVQVGNTCGRGMTSSSNRLVFTETSPDGSIRVCFEPLPPGSGERSLVELGFNGLCVAAGRAPSGRDFHLIIARNTKPLCVLVRCSSPIAGRFEADTSELPESSCCAFCCNGRNVITANGDFVECSTGQVLKVFPGWRC